MDDATRHQLIQWRKRLERKGWISIRRGHPSRRGLIEFHVIWQESLYSGRCDLAEFGQEAYWQPGTPAYLLDRQQDVIEGVWRRAPNQRARTGQVRQPLPI